MGKQTQNGSKEQSRFDVTQIVNVNLGSSNNKKDKKKCECSGFTDGPNVFVEICPRCKVEASYVVIPGFFSSTRINKPDCFQIDDTTYLTTTGRGVSSGGLEGAFTLTLVDSPATPDVVVLTLTATSLNGFVTLFIFTFADEDITITKCSDYSCSCKNSSKPLPSQLTAIQNFLESPAEKLYAKKVIYHNGVIVEEEDLKRYFQNNN